MASDAPGEMTYVPGRMGLSVGRSSRRARWRPPVPRWTVELGSESERQRAVMASASRGRDCCCYCRRMGDFGTEKKTERRLKDIRIASSVEVREPSLRGQPGPCQDPSGVESVHSRLTPFFFSSYARESRRSMVHARRGDHCRLVDSMVDCGFTTTPYSTAGEERKEACRE